MMLTTKGRYAVMSMVDLARFSADKPVSLQDISIRQGVTLAYLEQLFAKLRKNGLVTSKRGPGGGYILNQAQSDIQIAHIIDAVEEQTKMTRCGSSQEDGCMASDKRCLTHDLWNGLENSIRGYLNAVTLEDVCAGNVHKDMIFVSSDLAASELGEVAS